MKQIDRNMTPKQILSLGYARRLQPDEDGGYSASISEFPGCFADGDTADEALSNLDKVAESWLEVALHNGNHVRPPVDFDGFSGKIALRIPRSLHKQAAELADLEGTSLNQLLLTAISFYVGGKQLVHEIESIKSVSFTFIKADLLSFSKETAYVNPTKFIPAQAIGQLTQTTQTEWMMPPTIISNSGVLQWQKQHN